MYYSKAERTHEAGDWRGLAWFDREEVEEHERESPSPLV